MPTLEFFGMDRDRQRRLEEYLLDHLADDDFREDCVFVRTGQSDVLDGRGRSRPFVRVSTRSARRGTRFQELLRDLCDLEVVRIDFHPLSPLDETTTPPETFEDRLVDALQPIRGFALAQALHHLFASGLHASLAAGPATVGALAEQHRLAPTRLVGFLHYLANEEIVVIRDRAVALTDKGRQLAPFRPWYELLVGGYAETFQQLGGVLRGPGYATRDGEMVGVGSCGISAFDAIPLVRDLLSHLPCDPTLIADLGCGDGTFLTSLIEGYPAAAGVGVDPLAPIDPDAERVTFLRRNATDYVRSLADADPGVDRGGRLFLAAFLLQEILEQEGRSVVVELIRGALSHGGHLAVVEVDHRPTDPSVMRHGLGRSYYNPYYLLHIITEQRLETEEFWLELFEEAGATVVARRTVDPEVDSTGLELGYLLAPSRTAP